jgi:hypothetical protein
MPHFTKTMSTMADGPQNQPLQILSEEGPVLVGNMAGAHNPVAILDDSILDNLVVLCGSARLEAEGAPDQSKVSAVLELCAKIGEILELYTRTRNKYYGSTGAEVQAASALRELQSFIREAESFGRPR